MNKSEIRKKILNIRNKNNFKSFKISFVKIMNILKKEKIKGKVIGGYYPYNYEVNGMQILNEFKKKNILFHYPK